MMNRRYRIAILAVSLGAVGLFGPAAQAADYSLQELANQFQTSIFKVYAGTGNAKQPIGTATLIDRRGYFVTASHVVEAAPDYSKDRPNKYSQQLALYNPLLNTELGGREVFHSAPWEQFDVSVIKIDITPAAEQILASLMPVDPVITHPALLAYSTVGMLGYRIDEKDLSQGIFTPINTSSMPAGAAPTHFMAAVGPAFHGQSGSLALSPQGQAVGILHGPRLPDVFNSVDMKFTRVYSMTRFLATIPPRDHIVRLLAALKRNSLDAGTRLTLTACQFSSLDIIAFMAAIETDIPGYTPGMKANYRAVQTCLHRLRFTDQAERFSSLFYTPDVVQISTEIIDTARLLHQTARQAMASGVTTGREDRYLAASVALYQGALQTKGAAGDAPVRNAYLSNVYYDYALAQYESTGFDNTRNIETALHTSLTYNDNNYKTYYLAARAFQARGETRKAELAAATARNLALLEAAKLPDSRTPAAKYLNTFATDVSKLFSSRSWQAAVDQAATQKGQREISTMVMMQMQP